MISEQQIHELAFCQFLIHNLLGSGWQLRIEDEFDGRYGDTDFDSKIITLYREHWPTLDRNIRELIYHEIAHALCGHGEHNLEWWDKLIDIGGRGIWVQPNAVITNIGVQVTY